ncbi:hypothetical protein ARAM_006475 [Aspergillus rambellii]|uniref:3-ketosteroid reductase n=1 Tax=Aspergillus rambellii TaxID=308745 RepID=A0A0F8XD91_9EURO|nr:hypothetical protein ARAM_006475 [Aspergillus rambellii]
MATGGPRDALEDQIFVLVTGANSGLGYSICCRLVDEFLTSCQNDRQSLTIIFTTRSSKKGLDTLKGLQAHLRKATSDPTASPAQVNFVPENVDLSDLLSVRALSRRLQAFPKLDAIVLNAGIGGWTGIDWPAAIWGVATDLIHQVSWPSYKIAPLGMITEPQTRLSDQEPRLGAVFCANVFGHYMLAHNVMPLLHRSAGSPRGPGRVIWVSSLEATIKFFDINDLQGLHTLAPYESSKALTDILSLTSNLPSAAPWVKSFYYATTPPSASANNPEPANLLPPPPPPNIYLSHPGICGTGILPLSLPLFYAMLAAFYLARFLGSPWHTVATDRGARAPVWLALSTQSALDAAEAPYKQHGGGRVKWGRVGTRRRRRPAVLAADRNRRRKRGAEDLTGPEKERFEVLGRECWKQMEELRIKWDALLDEEEEERRRGEEEEEEE